MRIHIKHLLHRAVDIALDLSLHTNTQGPLHPCSALHLNRHFQLVQQDFRREGLEDIILQPASLQILFISFRLTVDVAATRALDRGATATASISAKPNS